MGGTGRWASPSTKGVQMATDCMATGKWGGAGRARLYSARESSRSSWKTTRACWRAQALLAAGSRGRNCACWSVWRRDWAAAPARAAAWARWPGALPISEASVHESWIWLLMRNTMQGPAQPSPAQPSPAYAQPQSVPTHMLAAGAQNPDRKSIGQRQGSGGPVTEGLFLKNEVERKRRHAKAQLEPAPELSTHRTKSPIPHMCCLTSRGAE